MEYTALIFDDCKEVQDSYDNLVKTIQVYKNDPNCKQVVVSCKIQWLLKLAHSPIKKVLLVQMSDKPYVALLNGLKAVTQENVLVSGLSWVPEQEDIDEICWELSQYPAIFMNKEFQAFDTRLLMFCLQMAIEKNLAIDTYAQAVESLSDTPLKIMERINESKNS